MTVTTTNNCISIKNVALERFTLILGAKTRYYNAGRLFNNVCITFIVNEYPVVFSYFFKQKTYYAANNKYTRHFVAYLIKRGL